MLVGLKIIIIVIVITNIFVWRHKVVTSEALGARQNATEKRKRESPGEEECR